MQVNNYFKANPSRYDSFWTRVIDLRIMFQLYHQDLPFQRWVIHGNGVFALYTCQQDIDSQTGPDDQIYNSFPAGKIDFSIEENKYYLQCLYIDNIYDYRFRLKAIYSDGVTDLAVLKRRWPLERLREKSS